MSQVNEEVPPEETLSSETSSGSSCSTATTNSHSGSSNCDSSTSSSDSENDLDNSHRHRHCHISKSQSRTPDGLYTASKIEDKTDDGVIDGKQSGTGQKCDNKTTTDCSATTNFSSTIAPAAATTTNTKIKSSPPSQTPPYPQKAQQQIQEVSKQKLAETKVTPDRISFADEQIIHKNHQYQTGRQNITADTTSLGSSYSNISSMSSTNGPTITSSISASSSRRILKPAPTPSSGMVSSQSPSLTVLDTNNNKNNDNISGTSRESLSSSKRTNFSKSISGSRLVNRSRPSACDCLSQDCGEKKHSNRRQSIEHYYNCRAQLSSANTSISSFNISTPLNRLNECDAITKRLLSSPIRTSNIVESTIRGGQMSDADKSRRASLGATTMTDQVFLYASNPFESLESSHKRSNQDKHKTDNQRKCDVESAQVGGENDVKSKQQQGRSLSVCDEETLNPRLKNNSSNHSSNLNRAISLACESGSTSSARRMLTLIPLFGCDIKSLEQFTSSGLILPPVIDSAVDHILANGINSVGIFRKSGVKTRILTLKQRIEANQFVKIDELNKNNEFSIYDIADLVKMWFRELKPVPLMSKDLIKTISAFLNSTTNIPQQARTILKRGNSSQQQKESLNIRSNISSSGDIDQVLKGRIDAITTPIHRALLFRALNFLAQISARCDINQMTSQNLAICLTPSLCETESDQNRILTDQKALEYCIDNHRALFGISNFKS